eukprot:13731272-Alexandrium_andersonii.AAC.1
MAQTRSRCRRGRASRAETRREMRRGARQRAWGARQRAANASMWPPSALRLGVGLGDWEAQMHHGALHPDVIE